MFKVVLGILITGLSAWAYHAIQPPPPLVCGSPGAPAVTAPRIKLIDGRHLAYKEHGVPKEKAEHKIVFVHGFLSCRHDATIATRLSPGTLEELSVHVVSFDRPGYGESDPNPKRTVKSMATDIEELIEQLRLGPKVYLVGFSMGGQQLWSCLKYIPHRIEGAALVAPVVNYWWTSFPASISREAYLLQFWPDQLALGIAHYAPWLTYWWNTQKWFPSSGVITGRPELFPPTDKAAFPDIPQFAGYALQQGVFESLHRDMTVGFGKWEFGPLDVKNPNPEREGSIQLWHGDEDGLVPVSLQRYIANHLPWIHYHELPGSGHLFPHAQGMAETILRSLLHLPPT